MEDANQALAMEFALRLHEAQLRAAVVSGVTADQVVTSAQKFLDFLEATKN